MSTAFNTTTTPTGFAAVNDSVNELQTRAKAAYEKGTEAVGEATEFAKGNVEALVESGKILAGGVQDLGKSYVEEAKSAYETMTIDLKEMAAVKSPTELFQLQSKILRRNFDSLVATSSKNSEALVKLAGDAFAPISGRVNVAAEKLTKTA
ncbi:TIGR01841 family phasin [Altererythrobacter xixiisoli]|uniref:TIGR01841 family phasin n=1 Tax=Croceibacterium xixiisoli TaxID=1476466 RepID=A0A6I4TRS5_9SPHN|nr:phasin family protein [Croceibacterium xixiisoli]MXO98009.1 TIGR01841 family phasin [Croceibacterium xixiisoli]